MGGKAGVWKDRAAQWKGGIYSISGIRAIKSPWPNPGRSEGLAGIKAPRIDPTK